MSVQVDYPKAIFLGIFILSASLAGAATTELTNEPFVGSKLTGNWHGLRDALIASGVTLDVTQTTDLMANIHGGVSRGMGFDGLLSPELSMDLGKLLGWSGGSGYVSAYVIQGKGISQTRVDNLMTVSNVEYARAGAKIGEFWIQQKLMDEVLAVKVGLIEGFHNFNTIDSAEFMMNATWTWPGIWEQNLPGGGPNYPNAVPGVQIIVTPKSEWTFQAAIFNGSPTGKSQTADTSGLTLPLGDGALSFIEASYRRHPGGKDGMPGQYKLGAWYNSERFNSLSQAMNGQPLAATDDAVPLSYQGNYSLYASLDQMIWRKRDTHTAGTNVFASLHMSPQSDRNMVSWFVEGGLASKGLIQGRPLDKAAIGFAYMRMSSGYIDNVRYENQYQQSSQPIPSFESIVEIDYQAVVSPWLLLQPFMTYVINPGGKAPRPQNNQMAIPNATVIGLRTIVAF
jgi:porin